MAELLVNFVLLVLSVELVHCSKHFSKHSVVPFTDDFIWDDQLDRGFGWRPNAELPTFDGKRTETADVQQKPKVEKKEKHQETYEATPQKHEVVTELSSTGFSKTLGDTDVPTATSIDACKRVFCRIGRTCRVSAEGKPECICAQEEYCRSHQKQVCGSDGLLYPSHCELHRVACHRRKHVGVDHTGKGCASGMPYTVLLTYPSVEHTTKRSWLTTPMSSTSGRIKSHVVCVEKGYNRFKNNLVHYHCARLGEMDCFFNHSKKKFVVSNMFNYYDANGNNVLEREELMAIEHLDHLDRLSQTCHLTDLLRFDDHDRESNGTISISEFFSAFKVIEPILEDNLKVFTTFVSTGNSVELKCGIRGANGIVWKRHNHVLDDSVGDDIKVLDDGSLYISRLELYHMGNYTCQGSLNDYVVQTHTLFIQMVPVVQVHPLTQFHQPGVTATIKCHADGVPLPEIFWEKNESPFPRGAENQRRQLFLHNNTTLEIKSLSYKIDTGAYKCIARNAAGSSHDIGTIVVENTNVPVHFSSELKEAELFAVFHDHGYTVYELNHCHIQHYVAGNFQVQSASAGQEKPTEDMASSEHRFGKLPDPEATLCPLNRTCSWGDAVNVRDDFVYVAQPDLHRILVIEVTSRMNTVEVIVADDSLYPVELEYVEVLDQIWVTFWTSVDSSHDSKVFQVINGASLNVSHHLTPLKGTDKIHSLFLPANNNLKSRFHYGYARTAEEMSLQRIDLLSLATIHTLDLTEHQCQPDAVAFLPLGGYVLVNCAPLPGASSFYLVVDYITDAVLKKLDVGGRFFLSPDARHLVIVGNASLLFYTITADGQIEHVFDRSVYVEVADLSFLPSASGVGYDIYGISKYNENIIHIDLATRKIATIEGFGDISAGPFNTLWGRRARMTVGSGHFAEHLLVSSGKSVVAIDGIRRRVHCEWQNVSQGNVIVSFVSSRF